MSDREPQPIRFSADALVILAGPSGSGKSTWARRWFEPNQVVSTDAARGVVGEHEHDLKASSDAFDLVEMIVARRLARGLFTVIDSLGMDSDRNDRWREIANEHGRPAHLVLFDEDPKTCRTRNRGRAGEVPSKVLTAQLEKWGVVKDSLGTGFEHVHAAGPAAIAATRLLPTAPLDAARSMKFGLLVSRFDWPGGADAAAERLGEIAAEAESAGFTSMWVMDHFLQIPQVGREWDPMMESMTTLGFLAGRTSRISLGAMVASITNRNIAHLGKIIATLDVLSKGRARCGLGVGWFEREQKAYGYPFLPLRDRYELLEDALELFPLLWGPGSPAFDGRRFSTTEAICYPRPIQENVPILIGGSGEKRTLRLVAQYADACNLFGEPEVINHKIDVLHAHCADLGRDPAEIEVTQLSSIISAVDQRSLATRIGELKAEGESTESFVNRSMAGTIEQHVDRFGRLGDAGVQTTIVSLGDVGYPESVAGFAPIIEELSRT